MKAIETPEEKRQRRLAKKEAKERKRKSNMGWDDETLVSGQYCRSHFHSLIPTLRVSVFHAHFSAASAKPMSLTVLSG